MKKITLIILALCLSFTVFAQSETDVTKKVVQPQAPPAPPATPPPVYQPKWSAPYDINLKNFTLQQLNDYLIFENYGLQIDDMDNISAKRAKEIKTNAGLVIKFIAKKVDTLLINDKIRWTTALDDSVKKAQSKIVKKP